MPNLSDIASGSSEDVRMLLQAMGQTSNGGGSSVQGNQSDLTLNDIASGSESSVIDLLRSMGQNIMPAKTTVTPLSRIQEIQNILAPNTPNSLEGVAQLLSSMGQTGTASKAKSSPSIPASASKNTYSAPATLEQMYASAIPSEPSAVMPAMNLQENLASVQDRVNYLLANDPAFKASVMGPEVDPLAADANGWNLPKTDKVNTIGASQRVNARTAQTGVRAVKQEDGSLLLTNSLENGTFAKGNMASGSTPGSIVSSIAALRMTNNSAEANVIVDNINATVAGETAKANKAALEFSENAAGIPLLQRKIFASEQMDSQSPNFVPGMGDSAMTKQLKAEMQQARGIADRKAAEFLATSPTLGVLKSQQLSAQQEMKRIDAKEVQARTVGLARETSNINREENAAQKLAVSDAKYEDVDRTITPEKRKAMGILNPALLNNQDPLAYAKEEVASIKDKSPNKRLAIEAFGQGDDTKLISLAISGNSEATALLYTKGKDKAAMDVSLKNVAFLANPNNIATYLDKKYGKGNSPAKAEEAKAMAADDNKGNDADKASNRLVRVAQAIDLERKQATTNFYGSVNSWQINDPMWKEAVSATQLARGTDNFDAVLNTYIGNSTGGEAYAKLRVIQDQGLAYMDSMPKGLFGKPDSSVLQRKLAQKAKDSGFITDIINRAQGAFVDTLKLMPGSSMLNFEGEKRANVFGDGPPLDGNGNLK